ncbi:unnamed protein product, partial [Ectocarpus sp. 8 AP-2014]
GHHSERNVGSEELLGRVPLLGRRLEERTDDPSPERDHGVIRGPIPRYPCEEGSRLAGTRREQPSFQGPSPRDTAAAAAAAAATGAAVFLLSGRWQ